MPTITQTVDVDFDLNDIDDNDLIDIVQERGYTVYDKLHHKDDDIRKLYTTYMTMSPEFFEKELKKYFREKLNVNLY